MAMRTLVGGETRLSRSDMIAELEAKNAALQRRVDVLQEALHDEEYENRRLQSDLQLAVDQGIQYRDALQRLIALREGSDTGASTSSPRKGPAAAAAAGAQKDATLSDTAPAVRQPGPTVGAISVSVGQAVGSVMGEALDELRRSCTAVVLGEQARAELRAETAVEVSQSPPEASPLAAKAGYQDSLNYSATSASPSPYIPRAGNALWTPDAPGGGGGGGGGGAGPSMPAGFDEGVWKRLSGAILGAPGDSVADVALVSGGVCSCTHATVQKNTCQKQCVISATVCMHTCMPGAYTQFDIHPDIDTCISSTCTLM